MDEATDDTEGARRRRLGDRTCLPRAVRPRGGRPGPRLRRHRRRRGGGPGRVHRRGRALAGRRAAAEPGGMDHHHGPQPRDRSPPPRGVARGPARPGRPAAAARRARRGGRRARRPAAADLHVLPPGARARRAGRADAAACSAASRPPRSPARSSSPSRRWPSGSCGPRARSATRASPTASRARPTSATRLRAVLAVVYLDLQRGLHGEPGDRLGARRSLRRGHSPRPAARRAACPTSPRSWGCSRSCCSSNRAARRARTADGELVLLADQDRSRWDRAPHRRGPGASSGGACGATSPARTRSRPRSTPCTATPRPRRPRIGGRSCSSTTSSWRSRRARSSRSTAPSPSPRSRGPAAALALVDAARPRRLLPVPRHPRRPAAAPRAATPRRRGRTRRPSRARDNAAERDFLRRTLRADAVTSGGGGAPSDRGPRPRGR